MMDSSSCTKLNAFAFGMAIGITKGLAMMLFAWGGYFGGYGMDMIHLIASVYHGYAPTVMGGFIGAGWGLLCGFVFGFIAGSLYNRCLGCSFCCKK